MPRPYERDERARIRALYDDAGLELCGISGNVPLLQDDRAAKRADETRFRTYLDFAAEIQHPGERLIVTTVSGGRAGEWDERESRGGRASLDGLPSMPTNSGSWSASSRMSAHALRPPNDAIWLVEQVDSAGLTIHFDISHFNVQGIPMEESVAKLTPISLHTHVKDERGIFPHSRVSDSGRRGDGLSALSAAHGRRRLRRSHRGGDQPDGAAPAGLRCRWPPRRKVVSRCFPARSNRQASRGANDDRPVRLAISTSSRSARSWPRSLRPIIAPE